jgi:hypothetical protein
VKRPGPAVWKGQFLSRMPSQAGPAVVTYRVRFEGAALVQLNGLPAAAFDALVQRVVDLVDEPWDASVMPPGDDPAFRMTVFDIGNGLLSFHADDIAEIIRIFDITWIG